jgi:anhydro-N-acetylmuramic acid kinase
MSGTSVDGIDAVACRVLGRGSRMRATVLQHVHAAYPSTLRRALLDAMSPATTTTETICDLNRQVGDAFAAAARRVMKRAGISARDTAVIGSHGQTLCHRPDAGSTLQIGCPAVIAQSTGCRVVADFRSADVAVGGQGAPLVPWTDWVLLRDTRRTRAVQNIGGIANVTCLPAKGGVDDVTAFDTGPGNMVMDELVRSFSRGGRRFDANGRLAARGRVCDAVLADWLSLPFFRRRPPKSCGREEFGRAFVAEALRRHARRRLRPEDWLATALALTIESIARAYETWLPKRERETRRDSKRFGLPPIDEVILCGGGSRNATLRRMLASRLGGVPIRRIEEFGFAAGAKEPVSFALLACARLDDVPANLPQVTGASRRVLLGSLTEP